MNQTILLVLSLLLLLLALLLWCRGSAFVAAQWLPVATLGTALSGLVLLGIWWFERTDPPRPSRVSQASQQGQPTLRGPQLPTASLATFQQGSTHMVYRVDAATIEPLAAKPLVDAPVHIAVSADAKAIYVATAKGVHLAPAVASMDFLPVPFEGLDGAEVRAVAVAGGTLFAAVEKDGKTTVFARSGDANLKAIRTAIPGSLIADKLVAAVASAGPFAALVVGTQTSHQLHLVASDGALRTIHDQGLVDTLLALDGAVVYARRTTTSDGAVLWRCATGSKPGQELPTPKRLEAEVGAMLEKDGVVLAVVAANDGFVLKKVGPEGDPLPLRFLNSTAASRVYGIAVVQGKACAVTKHGTSIDAWRQTGDVMEQVGTTEVANIVPVEVAATPHAVLFTTNTSLYETNAGGFRRVLMPDDLSGKEPIRRLRGVGDAVLFETRDKKGDTNVYGFSPRLPSR